MIKVLLGAALPAGTIVYAATVLVGYPAVPSSMTMLSELRPRFTLRHFAIRSHRSSQG
ncbi:MAG TPA: hypothetical protein VN706_11010 [Gemmatimonadaceae bacterium]|nr:hypothetical protein [Gemmatimonadaceae bacterium]